MKPGKTGEFVGSKIPKAMKQYIIMFVEHGYYISISDFVRGAIKEKLQKENPQWNIQLSGDIKDD